MADSATKARAEVIEGFAAVLSELRDSVGRPSFRAMAGHSGAISHTTLHEAVKGNRLPSWGTTAEFVRACGADPKDYRDRWERANRALGTVPTPRSPASEAPRAAGLMGGPNRVKIDVPVNGPTQPPKVLAQGSLEAGAPAADDQRAPFPAELPGAAPPRPAPAGKRGRRRGLYAVLSVAVVAGVATGAGLAWWQKKPEQPSPAAAAANRYVPTDCPVHQQNPPVQPPAHEGDRVAFVADITLPDCAHVRRGQTVSKVWRLKNTGTVSWVGYTLQRIDLPQKRGQCQTITDVPIADTPPGHLVDAKVQVAVPTTPGFCFVRFKLVDGQGRVAFPGSRPVNFQVIVD